MEPNEYMQEQDCFYVEEEQANLRNKREEELSNEDMDYEEDTNNANIKTKLQELKRNIVRLPDLEEKMGIKFENLSLIYKYDDLCILGDIKQLNSNFLKHDFIGVTATVFNRAGDIIAFEEQYINTENYIGLDNLDIMIDDIDIYAIDRIRLTCKPA